MPTLIASESIDLLERIAGSSDYGRFRGRGPNGPVLVTLACADSGADLSSLAAPLPGCVDSCWVGWANEGTTALAGAAEPEPPGRPSSEVTPEELSTLDRFRLAKAAERALRSIRAYGAPCFGLAPELLYCAQDGDVHVVVRASLVFGMLPMPDHPIPVPLSFFYLPMELLVERHPRLTEAAETYNLACLIGHWHCGYHPYGSGTRSRMRDMEAGTPDIQGLPTHLVEPVTAALQPDPARRPSTVELVEALSR